MHASQAAKFGEGFHHFVYAIGKGKRIESEPAAGDEGTNGGSERVMLKRME